MPAVCSINWDGLLEEDPVANLVVHSIYHEEETMFRDLFRPAGISFSCRNSSMRKWRICIFLRSVRRFVVPILDQAVCMGVKIDVLDSTVRMRSHSLNDGICERN